MTDAELESAMPLADVEAELRAEPDALGWDYLGARVPVAQAVANRCNMVCLRSLRRAALKTGTSVDDLAVAVKLNDIDGDAELLLAILNP